MKVLVTTASKHGATREIGTRIGSVLGDRGHQVEIREPLDVDSVEPYDVVVLEARCTPATGRRKRASSPSARERY